MSGAFHVPTDQFSGISAHLITTSKTPATLLAEVLLAPDQPEFGPYLPGLGPASTTFRSFRKVHDYRQHSLCNTIGVPTEQDLNNMSKTKKNNDGLSSSWNPSIGAIRSNYCFSRPRKRSAQLTGQVRGYGCTRLFKLPERRS